MSVVDTLDRPLRDLRVSVTDRCNFRCPYCMPKEIYGRKWAFLPRNELLTFEEISRLVRIFVTLGVEKVRLTGGEPLLRQDLEQLVRMLASIEALQDLTLTTNGSLLASRAERLKEAGLKRVTVSLDSLDETTFMAMNDVKFPLAQVLEGIEAATKAGLMPIKINMVVKRGVNNQDIVPMARYFRHSGHIVRFIEYMDVGHTNDWCWEEVVSAQEMIDQIAAHWPLERIASHYPGEVATRYRYGDGGGEIGIIASVTQPFCRGCTRARLAADGQLYTCLFGNRGHDLRRLLRSDCSDADIAAFLKLIWWRRNDRYSELRSAETVAFDKVEMSRIGG
ncbi:molybdenum cofactor biosynthesis protein A [Nitrosococcus halophilus Nc 4]|uniref:GTP 3',8-cyclase n=1 Tax=Nitrosococcus halophilus (strain Nc4) TaxID=472759 RepID=D5C130_NITHN|nr:GTP 3',8-cyclase MoaA [Nitrosococcus halophilus]ADE14587.1 molybdenum cofactor biosynthesis protein A [Nitrosococcus halophilus Nc 4]